MMAWFSDLDNIPQSVSQNIKLKSELLDKQMEIDRLKRELESATKPKDDVTAQSKEYREAFDIASDRLLDLFEINDGLLREIETLKNTDWHKKYQKVMRKLEKITNKNPF